MTATATVLLVAGVCLLLLGGIIAAREVYRRRAALRGVLHAQAVALRRFKRSPAAALRRLWHASIRRRDATSPVSGR